MAKQAPPEEREYRPVSEQLARSVLSHRARVAPPNDEQPKPDEPPASEPTPEDKPEPEVPEAKPQTAPLKVVHPKRGRASKASEPAREPVRAKRKEMTIERRMVVTPSENELFDELVRGIKRELRVTVNASNVLRACLTLLNHVQDELLKQCRRGAAPQAPRKDDPTSIQVFEEHLARLIDSAIRNTKSLD